MGNTGTQDQAGAVTLAKQAATAPAGFALQNATPNILQWNVPNDGQMHTAMMQASLNVTAAQTGGAVALSWTSGGHVYSVIYFNGGLGISNSSTTVNDLVGHLVCDPGTTVTLAQTTAQTAGAATLFATLLGA